MISSHMLHGVAVRAFRDFRIHSALRKITEKKLRTHQALGLMENLQFGRISFVDDIFPRNVDFLPNFSHNICELALPNKGISFVCSKEILQKFNRIIQQSIAVSVQEAIYSGDSKGVSTISKYGVAFSGKSVSVTVG